MKYIILITISFFILSCNEHDDKILTITPDSTGTYTDERDGTEYGWVRISNLEWMTSNMRYIPESGNYQPTLEDFGDYPAFKNNEFYHKYGMLYDLGTAMEIIPEGWRLPTDEDFKKLELELGLNIDELDILGDRGKFQGRLMQQDSQGTGLQFSLAGYMIYQARYSFVESITYEGVYGYYWTNTIDTGQATDGYYFYRRISLYSGEVYRNSLSYDKYLAVRCVRDAR